MAKQKQAERKDGSTAMVPQSPFALTAAATMLLAALVLCFSVSAGIFDASEDNRPVGNLSLYLRSKDAHSSDNSGSFVSSAPSIGNFEFEYEFESSALASSGENNSVRTSERRRLMTEEDDNFVTESRKNHFPLFEASDIFSVIGPTVFPKPTFVYGRTEDDSIIEDEIVTYLQPTTGQHRPNRDSVFVFASEYGFETYMLFFMTLYDTGFKGDVVVGISKMDWENKKIRKLLEYWKNENGEDEMTVVVYIIPYHCYNLEGEIQDSQKGGMRVCQCHNMFGQKNKDTGEVTPLLDRRHSRTGQTIRYELYWIWSQYYDPTSWILLIDARDTIFQESPFDKVPRRAAGGGDDDDGGTLIFFGENVDVTSLGISKYNRRWLTLAYGESVAKAFSEKPTICSGSTMGEQSAIEAYLRAEVAESDESKTVIFGADQGFHNYLYYSNKLSNARAISRILVQDQGLGIVNNMGALREKKLSEWGNGKIVDKTAESGITVYNWDGTVSPVVHQYDRFNELSNWWHKKKFADYQKKWKEMKK